MNLNKWLCKTFDINKKGYVTVLDIVMVTLDTALPYIIKLGAAFIIFVIGGVWLVLIQHMDTTKPINNLQDFFISLITAWMYPAVIIAVLSTSLYLLYKISQIKVAKCPLKENENK